MSDLTVTYNKPGSYAYLCVQQQGTARFIQDDPITNRLVRRVMAGLRLWSEDVSVESAQIIITLTANSEPNLSNDVAKANEQLAAKQWLAPYYHLKPSGVFPDEYMVRLGAPLWTKDEDTLRSAGVQLQGLSRQPHLPRTLWRLVKPPSDSSNLNQIFMDLDYRSSNHAV